MPTDDDAGAAAAPQPATLRADTPPIRGDALAARIDNLHADMLGGTALGHHTALWNRVHAFKERVKALVAGLERAAP
ncbi:hypothetical protein SAMN02799622_05556 [Methylobacterium sp. UNC378MF]|uniref:hypothetical protein n=1 Tax=Methylobacterium sp. UNC378MF TaxID=1502748 RepID=UPI00088CA60A|nr:hypothetical protein [Methylobacterium sp. UNC378MF]SDA33563.1 hypothetical protein SAMN02799622_05556 [Methylobacterium sp. UNC378MF]